MLPRPLTVFAAILFAGNCAPQLPILGHWQLDESAGTTAADVGLHGNPGTLVNFTGNPWVAGKFGNGLVFDGVDDYVDISIAGGLPSYDGKGSPVSIAFWVKAPGLERQRVYSEQDRNSSGSGPLMSIGSGNSPDGHRLRVYIRNDALKNAATVLSTGTVFDDTWHHVVWMDVCGKTTIYIDGVLDSTYDYSTDTYGHQTANYGTYGDLNSVTLGAVVRSNVVAAPLAGALDDVRVYRAALSQADVTSIYVNGQPTLCTASVGVFGVGCGPRPLQTAWGGAPVLGGTMDFRIVLGTANETAMMCFGVGALDPLDLGALGLPGCTLYQRNSTCFPFGVLDSTGTSPLLSIPVPNVASLSCTLVCFQGAAVGTASASTSSAIVAHVGY